MKRLLPAVVLLPATPAAAQLDQATLDRAVARPPADARLPAGLRFRDDRGAAVTLGEIAAGRPLVLLFADYTCRHICGPGLALTVGALRDSGAVAGRDYALAVIGLDPRDTADDARHLAAQIGGGAVRREVRLLIGTPATVAAAERALGYSTAYDAQADQFAHDASVYIFAPDGRLTTLLPELGLQPAAVRVALSGDAPAGLADRVAHLCYGLAALRGRYATPVVLALQALAALTLVAGGVFVWRRRHT